MSGEEINEFILKNYENMSRREIAETLGVTKDTIKARIARLRKRGLIAYEKSQQVLYTDEVNSFLLQNYLKFTYKELTEKTIEKFGGKFTLRGVATQVQHLEAKLNLPRKVREKKETVIKEKKKTIREMFSDESNEWLKENHLNYHFKELTTMFNQKFGTNWTEGQIARHCAHDLDLRAKQEDKKCYKPGASRPIGSERVGEKGFVEIKIAENKWVLKHRYMWEQYNNKKIPPNHYVIFMDGDKTNFSKENLVCVPDCVQGHLTSMPTNCAQLKRLKITSVKLAQILGGLK